MRGIKGLGDFKKTLSRRDFYRNSFSSSISRRFYRSKSAKNDHANDKRDDNNNDNTDPNVPSQKIRLTRIWIRNIHQLIFF